jgi:hypothetical protein
VSYTLLNSDDGRQIKFLGYPFSFKTPNEKEDIEIPYTPEMGDFFNRLGKALAEVALQLSKLNTKERLFENVSKLKLLG